MDCCSPRLGKRVKDIPQVRFLGDKNEHHTVLKNKIVPITVRE